MENYLMMRDSRGRTYFSDNYNYNNGNKFDPKLLWVVIFVVIFILLKHLGILS